MEGCTVADVKENEQRKDEKLFKIRHSTAHVMAEAVLRLFPDAKLAIGPAIENGFYYDFDLPRSLKPEDLEEIENIMKDIVKQNHEFDYKVVSREEAKKLFADQPYKLELVNAIPEGDTVSLYTQDTFTDLCRGPHVENTKEINPGSFKLLSIAGAYWRGNEKNPMLQRNLRYRLGKPERPPDAPRDAQGYRTQGSPQTRERARSFLDA